MGVKTKPSKIVSPFLAVMAAGSVTLMLSTSGYCGTRPLGTRHHSGHDHSAHDHSAHDRQQPNPSTAPAVSKDTVRIDAATRTRVGIEVAEVPTRAVGDQSDEVSALPKGSVFSEDGKHFVFALPDGATDRFERWEVTLGAKDDFFVEIKTGVFPGDRIVIAGVGSIRQMADSAGIPATLEEADVAETAESSEAPASAPTSPGKELTQSSSLGDRVPPTNGASSQNSEPNPGSRTEICECVLLEILRFYDPYCHPHDSGRYVTLCYEGYPCR